MTRNPNKISTTIDATAEQQLEVVQKEGLDRQEADPEAFKSEIENAHEYANTLNQLGDKIDRLETALQAMGYEEDDDSWTDPDEGIDGGAALVKLAERIHAKDDNYKLAEYEEKFLLYEDSVIASLEARASVDDVKLREKFPAAESVDEALIKVVGAKHRNDVKNQEKYSDPDLSDEEKQAYKGDLRKLPGQIINEERTLNYLENSDKAENFGNNLLNAGDELAKDSGDIVEKMTNLEAALEAAGKMSDINASITTTLTSVAKEFPNGEYESPAITEERARAEEKRERRRRRDGRTKQAQDDTNATPGGKPEGKRARRERRNASTQTTPDDPNTDPDDDEQQTSGNQNGTQTGTNTPAPIGNNSGNNTPVDPDDTDPGDTTGNNAPANAEAEKPKKSPEYIRQERLLLGIQRGLAAAQAELTSNMNPFQRKDLKNKVAKLEVEYDKLVKRISILELRDDEALKQDLANNPGDTAEIIGQAVENKVSMRYDQLADMTGDMQGSTTMEFLEKHGTKIALGATALGGIVGLGVGGAVTGAAVGLGLKVMTKRYHAQKGRNIGKMTNFKGTDSNGETFYNNNKLRESIQAELKKINHGITAQDSPDIRARKEAMFVNNLFNEAFRAATTEARHEYNTAVQKEFTRGYLGSIAAGMATSAAVYVGGHVAGNMLHYQLFGGPGSARWTLSTLDSQGQGAAELLGKVGYDPSSMSLTQSAFSNFAPFGR